MTNRKRVFWATTALFSGLLVAGAASAQSTGTVAAEATELDTVVVTGVVDYTDEADAAFREIRDDLNRPLDAPAPVTVIDREMVAASGFNEIHDLLRLVPGDAAEVAFDGIPGRVFTGKVKNVISVIGEGQIQPSGTLLSYTGSPPPGRARSRRCWTVAPRGCRPWLPAGSGCGRDQ